ncbi:iron ABC transporter permease [Urechidicola sp. KH5]
MPQKSYTSVFVILLISLLLIAFANLSSGSVYIPIKDVLKTLIGSSTSETWSTILLDYRLPKTITAIFVGGSLAVSGLLMQTLFRNPLAGPFVLGISSGASLGVALYILGGSLLGFGIATNSSIGLAIAASLGAFLVLLAVLLVAKHVRNTMSILIIGLMFGSFTAAIISVLAYFSQAEQLQQFIFWGFGSLGNLSWKAVSLLLGICGSALIGTLWLIKPLNSWLLGENYAKSLGVSIEKWRMLILIITSILTGCVTAYAGPIAFVGLAVPHLTKLVFNTANHKIILPASCILGAIVMLIADIIAQLPTSAYTLPINAITSFFGAPVVIWLIIRKRRLFV